MFERTLNFLREGIWRKTSKDVRSPFQRIGLLTLKTVLLVIRGFSSKRLNVSANSLTYSLTFSIIPILAMVLAVARGFGFSDLIYKSLNNSFLQETNMIPVLMEMVDRYLETAQGGMFIGVGIIVLLWSIYSFFSSVETLFNEIWNVSRSRSILHQTVTYIAILFTVPVLIIVSSGISVFVNTFSLQVGLQSSSSSSFLHIIQFVMVWLVFSLLFKLIPNTKVRLWCAVIPGVLMGSLYQLIQSLWVYVLMFLSRTSIVYGAFASIPIVLTWLQWTCLLILIGAQMSYAIQNNEQFEYEKDLRTMSRKYKDTITFFILSVLVHRFESGLMPFSSRDIAQTYHFPIRLVNQILSRLVAVGLVNELSKDEGEDSFYQPALDTHKISLGMVISRIENQGNQNFIQQTNEEVLRFNQHLNNILNSRTDKENILISEI